MKEIRLLTAEDVDVRIQSVNKGGARLLLFKNARVDMNILDETFGPLNWQRRHTRDNQNCIVSIWDDGKKQWIEKEDTGTESNTEKEKGLASDSFKRACFNVGIGRELYTAPDMFVFKSDLKTFSTNGDRCTCFDKFTVTGLEYDGRTICRVVIRNDSNGRIISFGESKPAQPAQPTAPTPRAVTQADKDKLKAWADKKGMNMSIVMTMAGVETMDGLTAEGYNAMAKVLREM